MNHELGIDWKTLPSYLRPTHASFLLSDFVIRQVRHGSSCVELGCGAGAVALTLARSGRFHHVVGIDRDHEAVSIARELYHKLKLEIIVEFLEMDMSDVRRSLSAESFDVAVMNPPFHLKGQPSFDPKRNAVRSGDMKTVKSFIEAAVYLLKNRGELYMVVKPSVAMEFVEIMLTKAAEPKSIQPVYGRGNREAFLLLIKAIKNGGRELHVLPPIILS